LLREGGERLWRAAEREAAVVTPESKRVIPCEARVLISQRVADILLPRVFSCVSALGPLDAGKYLIVSAGLRSGAAQQPGRAKHEEKRWSDMSDSSNVKCYPGARP